MSSDPYPPTRVDVSVLFGEELAGRGHRIDWILQSEADCERAYVTPWGGGACVGRRHQPPHLPAARIPKHLAGIWNDARVFGLLRGDRYDAIEVKDKFLGGVFAVLAARLHGKSSSTGCRIPFRRNISRGPATGGPLPVSLPDARPWISVLLYRILLPAADHVFVQSEQMRRDVAAEGIPLAKLTAVPMGIKMDSRASLPAARVRSRIPRGSPASCISARSAAAAHRFSAAGVGPGATQMPDVKLYLVGQGELPGDEEFLKREAHDLGVAGSVIFTGQLPPQAPSSTCRMRMSAYRRSIRRRCSTCLAHQAGRVHGHGQSRRRQHSSGPAAPHRTERLWLLRALRGRSLRRCDPEAAARARATHGMGERVAVCPSAPFLG